MDNCIFCGNELDEKGLCNQDHNFKKMCINCQFSSQHEDGSFVCNNEANMENARLKMVEEVEKIGTTIGYKADFLIKELVPLPLKKPLSRCQNWKLGISIEKFNSLFV